MKLLDATRVMITIQMVDDTNELIYLFTFVTTLFELMARLVMYVGDWFRDIIEAAHATGKVLAIGFNSFRFGVGI